MKFILLGALALVGVVNTQAIFDYNQFVKSFNLQPAKTFDHQRFESIFLDTKVQSSENSGELASNSFDYDGFAKLFLQKTKDSKDFDYQSFAKALLGKASIEQDQQGSTSQITGNFDYQKFQEALKIQSGDNSQNTFDYDAFVKSLNLANQANTDGRKFDSEGFLQSFGLKKAQANVFDSEKFNQTFGLNKAATEFDH